MTTREELIEKGARAITKARGSDPDEITYWYNGEIQEPYGPMWLHSRTEAESALDTVLAAVDAEVVSRKCVKCDGIGVVYPGNYSIECLACDGSGELNGPRTPAEVRAALAKWGAHPRSS